MARLRFFSLRSVRALRRTARAEGVGEVARMGRGRFAMRSLKRVEAVSGEKARVRRVCAKGVGSAMVVVVGRGGCGSWWFGAVFIVRRRWRF